MVDEKKSLDQTDDVRELGKEIAAMMAKQQEYVEELKKELRDTMRQATVPPRGGGQRVEGFTEGVAK